MSAYTARARPSQGHARRRGRDGWSATGLTVLDDQAQDDPVVTEMPDFWTGLVGEGPVIAFPADTSIQVRGLTDGHLVAVRMTGWGTAGSAG